VSPSLEYPLGLTERVILPNQKRLRIRALRRCEDGPIRELFARLTSRTRQFRFLSPLPSVPDSLIRQIVTVDYQRQLALVAEDLDGASEDIVGLANFGAIDDRTAEVALVVRDEWQRQHVGTELAIRMLRAAEARGFERFVANMHAENVGVRRLLKHVGVITSYAISGAITELTFVARRSRN
jgi:RimJ/RimL family protein N-acetyltransferase